MTARVRALRDDQGSQRVAAREARALLEQLWPEDQALRDPLHLYEAALAVMPETQVRAELLWLGHLSAAIGHLTAAGSVDLAQALRAALRARLLRGTVVPERPLELADLTSPRLGTP